MWTNISGVVGAAIQKVQKFQNEIESQLDQAVGVNNEHSNGEVAPVQKLGVEDAEIIQNNQISSSTHNPIENDNAVIPESITLHSSIDKVKSKQDNITKDTNPPTTEDVNKSYKASSTTPKKSSSKKTALGRKATSVNNLAAKASDVANLDGERPDNSSTKSNNVQSQSFDISNSSEVKWQSEIDAYAKKLDELKSKHCEEINAINLNTEKLLAVKDGEYAKKLSDILKSKDDEYQSQLESVRNECQRKVIEIERSCLEKINSANQQSNTGSEELNRLSTQNIDLLERINVLEDRYQKLQSQSSAQLQQLNENLKEKEALLLQSTTENDQLRIQLQSQQSEKNKFLQDLNRLKEIVQERERALESASIKLAETHKQLEESNVKISDLKSELLEKDQRSRQLQATVSADENESKRLLAKLQEELKEKNERLSAFEVEGQQLAKKQSEMEKNVRKSRQEVKEKEQEITKLRENKDQLMKALEQAQELVKKQENEVQNTQKMLQAMQAVSNASTDKLTKLEAELHGKQEEMLSQRKALENAWNDANELKRQIAELKADRDDLKQQLEQRANKAMDSESIRREVEQREAVLRATSKQLEESLRQQMSEATQREERLRVEIGEMQRRWQEAVSSREQLASELAHATAPLLRQISSLQETLRVKSDQWQTIESSLSERLFKAENASEAFEHRKVLLEDQIASLKQQISQLSSRYQECFSQLQNNESLLAKLQRQEKDWYEEKNTLETKLSAELKRIESLQSSMREQETRQKIEMQELKESFQVLVSQRDLELMKMKNENESLLDQLNQMKLSSSISLLSLPGNGSKVRDANSVDSNKLLEKQGENHAFTNTLPNGEISFVAAEKLMQRNRHRDEEIQTMQAQILKLEASRNALLEEVNFLSSQNAKLEDELHSFPSIKEELHKVEEKLEIALVLLGEKEEELDAAMADMKEIKHMYQSHIEELMGQLIDKGKAT